ncbi:MAG: nucleoside/nucleotide kinase family protein [Rhizobiales bacterium]|nr:nucleoside/nucleotide kinase family protein [Hyphomicrobiales bacterium]MBA68904.1 nucleoside/nucleotide kinase family protein [Hyphomicrobiales bacterium]|tara:strand:+ start:126 stop:770 length:645 start_codon:yes stop_codon:yes gene_type:complete
MPETPLTIESVSELAAEIRTRAIGSERFIVAIAGPPGAGKTTLVEALREKLSGTCGPPSVVPMDGYHLDNAVLAARGHLSRKGAPFTFDADGYRVMIERLREDSGNDAVVPLFDRTLDVARAGAGIVPAGSRIVLTEGNYLLLDEEPWSALGPLFDLTVMIDVDRSVLEERLVRRWLDHGHDRDAAERRARDNDMVNAALVLTKSQTADVLWRG